METVKTVVTREGKEELEKEYEYLVHTEREIVAEELKAARSQGDLSENADYDAARDHQGRVEARIRELDAMLTNIEIIEEEPKAKGKNKVVKLGSTIIIEALDIHETQEYSIVGTVEADPLNGKLSNESPLAVAVLDHKVGDTVTVFVAHPYKVTIKDIK